MVSLLTFIGLLILSKAAPILYDGRASLDLTSADLNASKGPYLTIVKGSKDASQYSSFLGKSIPPTPLWSPASSSATPIEQAISISIDGTSIFTPGSNPPQNGFRRTELVAQSNNAPFPTLETGTTVLHFSIQSDESRPLNFDHEYQIVFVEPDNGSQVFSVQLGSPLTNPTGPLPDPDAHSFKVVDSASKLLFSTPFSPGSWHNFAIQVDWNSRTLAVLYSQDEATLAPVTKVVPNPQATSGPAGQGNFHFGLLKLPLVNPKDPVADQSDVIHHGTQEGSTEALIYSGVFMEDVSGGISVGQGKMIPALQ